jgi:AcrR family transcriptional regulator
LSTALNVSPITQEMPAPTAIRHPRADAVRNRERVIAAARKAMAHKGLDAQMEEIARGAKVGVGTVYRHFPTKDDLVDALAAARFERLAELADEALEQPDAGQAFDEFIRAAAEIQVADRALSEVLVSRPETMRRSAESVDMLGRVAKVMARAQEAGAIRRDARPEDVPMMMCALAGACSNPMTDPERYLGIVIDGLRAPGATPLPPRSS